MRGGLERWKRGADSHGVSTAIAYALDGTCDAAELGSVGRDALAAYGDDEAFLTRFTVQDGQVSLDELDRDSLTRWIDGADPVTGERRGRALTSPDADLVLDGTINAPKSYSLVAHLHPELAAEFEALQDRLRDRIITTWQRELNARRGAGGRIREDIRRLEVVELRHRRSRALDPHIHRHLWLSVKVKGADGNWSNVDSRVAMRLHTLINAEGELAARTDPDWVAALARHGYTLNRDGEIAEVAHAVRAFSRRSTQIEANRAVLLAQWQDAHAGRQPTHDDLHQIDRHAWAKGRPGKPGEFREDDWEHLIREELTSIDPTIADARRSRRPSHVEVGALDWEVLAARAIVDADTRSTGYGGRFSMFDLRAGATRALAASGVVHDRDELDSVIAEIVRRTRHLLVDLIGEQRPQHVKAYMATATAALKVELATLFDELNAPGSVATDELVAEAARSILGNESPPDSDQTQAVAAIAGTHTLVTVTGPAGAGKTTILKIARAALRAQGRQLIVVAPTKKGASVAGRETGAPASSLHALLADYGWRWGEDHAGSAVWTRLRPGDVDPTTGLVYGGPRGAQLRAGDRIVVDEAGMVDLHTARALAIVAQHSGAGLAMVGDHLQAAPVGHAGAMVCMARRSGAVVDLTAVHRFQDPGYAALTVRMREPRSQDEAFDVAHELDRRGLITAVISVEDARKVMVDGYFRWAGRHKRVALVTKTNEEAEAINVEIQQRRIDAGELRLRRIALGAGERRILEGDVVQTRRNDRVIGVENRALWVVHEINGNGVVLSSVNDRHDTRTVSFDYAADFVQLAYASTVHGIQGETTDASIVGPGVDAAGLYVGMTRGRYSNEAVVVARSTEQARTQIADSMTRGTLELTLEDSQRAARAELNRAALTPDWNEDDYGPTRATPTPLEVSMRRYEELDSLIGVSQRSLEALDARASTMHAVAHARPARSSQLGVEPAIAEMATALHDRLRQRAALAADIRRLQAAQGGQSAYKSAPLPMRLDGGASGPLGSSQVDAAGPAR